MMSRSARKRRAARKRQRQRSGGLIGGARETVRPKRWKDRSALGKAAGFLPPVAMARGLGRLFGGKKRRNKRRGR